MLLFEPSAAAVADPERLKKLAAIGVLDTPPEQDFDDLAHLAADICAAPTALISFVDADRQWFKAKVGFEASQTCLDRSVCRFVLVEPDLLVIPDLRSDPRTADNPLVTAQGGIRFYAGAPLRTRDGVVLGALCVIDTVPRPGLTASQADSLRRIARQVMAQCELRRIVGQQGEAAHVLSESADRKVALADFGDELRATRDVAAMSYAAARTLGVTLGAVRAGYGAVDAKRESIEVAADWCAPGVASVSGVHDFRAYGTYIDDLKQGRTVVVSDAAVDPRTAAGASALAQLGVCAMVNSPVMEGGTLVSLSFVHFDRPREIDLEDQAFIRAVADRTQVGIARLQAEERQAVLNGEISHRLKNVLAMVQALGAQTLRGEVGPAVLTTFNNRLAALGRAQDVLMAGEGASADLDTLARGALELAGAVERCDIAGPATRLGPRAALSVSLLLHELATNARKYGALSSPKGEIVLRWGVEEHETGEMLVVNWRERGGPPAVQPTRKGFGSRLLRLGLIGTGGVELSYGEDGFSASFRAPLRQAETA